MSSNPIKPGPTTETVRRNIRRLRRARDLTLVQLGQRLADAGRPMLDTVVSKVERGERRIDVDDLAAFAAVLGVTAAQLLEPDGVCSVCHSAPKPMTACLACGAEGAT